MKMREGTMPSATKSNSSNSSEEDNNGELRRGPWTLEEDSLLIHYIAKHGEGRWNLLAKRSGLKRTGKSCRLRWLNYLKPDVKRGNLTTHEQLLILDLHSKWGNKWSKIAKHLPGRTDNEIKNYWRTRVQKQAKHLKIDANSIAFKDIIRCIWMPRLLQKIENVNSLSSSHPTICSTPLNPSSQLPPPPLLQQQPPPLVSQQVSQLSFDTIDNISKNTSNVKDCDYMDYDMQDINLTAMSASPELFEDPTGFCNVLENMIGWDTEWNIDELWGCRTYSESSGLVR